MRHWQDTRKVPSPAADSCSFILKPAPVLHTHMVTMPTFHSISSKSVGKSALSATCCHLPLLSIGISILLDNILGPRETPLNGFMDVRADIGSPAGGQISWGSCHVGCLFWTFPRALSFLCSRQLGPRLGTPMFRIPSFQAIIFPMRWNAMNLMPSNLLTRF